MHLTRAKTHRAMKHARKGKIYIARPLSHASLSVSVLHALRDILGIVRTAREAKTLVNEKKIKINGRVVRDFREPIHLFNILEVDKRYLLTLTPNGKYSFIESKKEERVAKIIGKRILKNGVVQINFHDGTNSAKKMGNAKIGDSAKLKDNEIVDFIKIERGSRVFVYKGRNKGHEGKVNEITEGKKSGELMIDLKGRKISLGRDQVIAI